MTVMKGFDAMKVPSNNGLAEVNIVLADWNSPRGRRLAAALAAADMPLAHVDTVAQVDRYCPAVMVMPATWPCNGHGGKPDVLSGLAVLSQLRRLPSQPEIIVFREAAEAVSTSDCCHYLLQGASRFVESENVQQIQAHIEAYLRA